MYVQIVRTAFNVAIGTESEEIKRTAKNALLQMLNTIVKRVTQYPLVTSPTPLNDDEMELQGSNLYSNAYGPEKWLEPLSSLQRLCCCLEWKAFA